jgi:hypothetical protein
VAEQDEIERLQYMHGIFNMMFDNRLIFPPVPRPRRILECGSGSGAWAMEVAEQYPECEVGKITPVGVALVLLTRGATADLNTSRVDHPFPITMLAHMPIPQGFTGLGEECGRPWPRIQESVSNSKPVKPWCRSC